MGNNNILLTIADNENCQIIADIIGCKLKFH